MHLPEHNVLEPSSNRKLTKPQHCTGRSGASAETHSFSLVQAPKAGLCLLYFMHLISPDHTCHRQILRLGNIEPKLWSILVCAKATKGQSKIMIYYLHFNAPFYLVLFYLNTFFGRLYNGNKLLVFVMFCWYIHKLNVKQRLSQD